MHTRCVPINSADTHQTSIVAGITNLDYTMTDTQTTVTRYGTISMNLTPTTSPRCTVLIQTSQPGLSMILANIVADIHLVHLIHQ